MPFPLEERFVREAEAALGVRFPGGFVGKMRKDNGGSVDCDGDLWQLIPFLDKSDAKRIKRTCNDLVRETRSAREWPGFPTAGVAFAADGGGNFLVFLPSKDRPAELADTVHRWDHETGECEPVSDDFLGLMES